MTTNHRNTVSEFARAVREQLSDLPALDVEELTEGLEADLAERLAEDGSELGDPVAYADELRASAGLGIKEALPATFSWSKSMMANARATVASLRTQPATASLLEFLIALRPVWWVLRGWIVFGVLLMLVTGQWPFFPRSFVEFILWVALIAVSVQWGRGRWLGAGRMGTGLKTAVSVGAAVLLVPLVAVSFSSVNHALSTQSYYYDSAVATAPLGVSSDGSNVSNIFAYDCSGKPMRDVQLFDQDGKKLSISPFGDEYSSYFNEARGEEVYGLPSKFVSAGEGWNVVPLEVTARSPYEEDGNGQGRLQAPLPFASVQPLQNECEPASPPVQLPSATPTVPTLEPESVKASDAKDAEGPTPGTGTPAAPESGAVKESKEAKEAASPESKEPAQVTAPSPAPSGK